MSKDLNNVFIIGRLTKNPELRYTSNGNPVTKFSIANNNSYTKEGNKVDETNYFDVNVWGNQAVNVEKYCKKGQQVAISGSLKQNKWTDKDGQNRAKIEITANSVQFLGNAEKGEFKESLNIDVDWS